MNLTIPEMLDIVVHKLEQVQPELKNMDAVFQLEVTGPPNETYQLLVKEKRVQWYAGTPLKATCTVQISRENLYKLIEGNLDPASALLTGKIKIRGDRAQLLKLQSVLSKHIKNLPRIF